MAADKMLTCRDCGANFVFTGGEQEFFAQKGFSEPSRCPACRQARKQERLRTQQPDEGFAAPGSEGGGRGGRGGRGGSRGGDFDSERPRRGKW